MVEETIKTIKEAENEAEEILRKADASCAEILESAAVKAKTIKEEAETEAKAKAEADLSSVKKAGEKAIEEAGVSVDTEIIALKQAAAVKETAAISAVIEKLV